MSHTLLTIAAPVQPEHVEPARALIEALCNPASAEVAAAIDGLLDDPRGLAIHFSSLNVFDASAGGGHLVFELSADGEANALLSAVAERLGSRLSPIFALARDRGSDQLDAYWKAHLVPVGQGFFDNPGVVFAGTPGLSVRRIRQECALAAHVSTLLGDQAQEGRTAFDQLTGVRRSLNADPQWRWALVPERTAALDSGRSIAQAAGPLVWSAVRTYLWPLVIPPVVALIAVFIQHGGTGTALVRAVSATLWTTILTLLAAILALGLAYVALRRKENSNIQEDRPPDPRIVARTMARENFALQNHLAAVSVMKPGLLRRVALVRVVFWLIANLATHLYRPGFLGTLGTIHFARWVMVPGTGDLLFLSNYGGSWESYLEDFITKAHFGLTARLVEHRRLPAHGEPHSGRRDRRRAIQALGAATADSDRVLVRRPIRT